MVYRVSIPRYLLARALGRWIPSLYWGRLSSIALTEVPEPQPRGPDWVTVQPVLAGVCGTDLATITGKTSPSLSPFSSFPAVLGHEVLGRVTAAGPAVRDFAPGDRVVIDPLLPCRVRGLDPCPACSRGEIGLCENQAEGDLSPGAIAGYCRDVPGGWSERMAVHASQLHRVPNGVPDQRAVLVEPLSVALHAVLRRVPDPGSRVLVIGAGTIGLLTVAALRLVTLTSGTPREVTLIARHPFQAELGRALGADRVYRGGDSLQAAVEVTGARRYRPLLGRDVVSGGFDAVYDCVGSRRSLDDGLRVTRPGGTLVVIGGAGTIPNLDWSFVWARELAVLGSYCYGLEDWQGERLHTFDLALRLLEQHPEMPLERLVTHRFSLEQYREAIAASLNRKANGTVKTVFAGLKQA